MYPVIGSGNNIEPAHAISSWIFVWNFFQKSNDAAHTDTFIGYKVV